MKRQKAARIPTGGQSAPLASPFAALDLQAPPPKSETTETPPSQQHTRPPETQPDKNQGTVLLRRETAHRHGGAVVVIMDFSRPHNLKELEQLATDLKKHCATGGTVKNGRIEIQGDMLPRVKSRLQALGYTPRGG